MAALILMNKADEVLAQDNWRKELIQWCVHRQAGGMQGRPNKDEDTCYSYWIGGTLNLLGQDHLLDVVALRQYVMSCQFDMGGGFGKVVGAYPDLLHSFYSMAWLSLSTRHGVEEDKNNNDQIPLHPLNCTLGIRQDRAAVFGGDIP
jgi:geranylgeranyl transferase type-1 subunit beta